MSAERELKKLELLIKYSNKLITKNGQAEQVRLSKLDFYKDDEYFNDLLYVSQIYPTLELDDYARFDVRSALYKRINNQLRYITLLDCDDAEREYSQYDWYESKHDIDNCAAAAELKKEVRARLKNPDDYWRTSNC